MFICNANEKRLIFGTRNADKKNSITKVAGATTILREGFHITGDDQSSLGTGF
jgi:hypothetical protein